MLPGATGASLVLNRDHIDRRISARTTASASGYRKSTSTATERTSSPRICPTSTVMMMFRVMAPSLSTRVTQVAVTRVTQVAVTRVTQGGVTRVTQGAVTRVAQEGVTRVTRGAVTRVTRGAVTRMAKRAVMIGTQRAVMSGTRVVT